MIPLASMLRETTRLRPEHPAIVTETTRISYRELDRTVDRLVDAMARRGVEHGDRVAVMALDTIEHIATAYAIARLGAIFVPINYRLRADEVGYLVGDTEPVMFFADPDYVDIVSDGLKAAGSNAALISFGEDAIGAAATWQELVADGCADLADRPVELDDIMQIQYSSGTTGLPKGAVLTHRTLMSRMLICAAETPRLRSDVYFNAAPFFHVSGSQFDYMMHLRGGTVIRHRQFDPARAVRGIVDEGATCGFFVPSMINFMLRTEGIEREDFTKLRFLEYGAAPMPGTLLRDAMATFGCDFVQLFGAGTEGGLQAVLPAADHHPDGSEAAQRRLGSVGLPAMACELKIVDDDGRTLPPGEAGEIVTRSAMNMREYWRKPEATADTLRDGWLHAGDVGRLDDDGYLYLVDRKNDMIIRGGENIYPAEIELVLHDHESVLEAAVIGVPDDEWGESVTAVVVLHDGATATSEELIEYCRSRLASYKKPSRVEFVDTLPRNASGKVLKRELRRPYWEGRERQI